MTNPFQVARGGTENWYNHLMAAPKIFPFLRTYCTHTVVLDASETPKSSLPRLSLADHAAVEFFNGVIIWLDILGSASTGLRPQYADICSDGLGDNSKLQLRKITGCENWTMVLIREIAVLLDWKHEMSERKALSVLELARRGVSIHQRLDAGINKLDAERDQYSDYPGQSNQIQSSEDERRNNYVISQVTYAYACAAKVYLNVVLSGANPNIPEIAHSVSMAAAALTSLTNPQLIQRLVWPFCIAGCMARGNQRQAFRDLASKAFMGGGNIGSLWKAFAVIQTCWELHDNIGNAGRNSDWLDSMKCLGSYVLLV